MVYLLLIGLGAMSVNHFAVSSEGGTAFNQIVTYYFGAAGHALLAAMLTLTCLTTAVGLVAAFAQDFHKHFPKVSYRAWLAMMSFASFLTANFGLDTIIQWSTPMLMFLYPLAMVLIGLSVASHLFHRDPVVYGFVVAFTVVPALMDMVASFPAVISKSGFGLAITHFRDAYLPFSSLGLGWVAPALVGLAIGLTIHFVRQHQAAAASELD